MKFLKTLAAVLVVTILILVAWYFMFIQNCSMDEVERYSIAMEVTHAEESAYYIRNHGVEVKRTFYLRGDDKAIAVEVDEETYARFIQGDWVEVEIQVLENSLTHTIKEHAKIIGEME